VLKRKCGNEEAPLVLLLGTTVFIKPGGGSYITAPAEDVNLSLDFLYYH